MADPRTFTLIGEFRDEISPSLEKINNSIASLKRNLGGFGGKKGSFNDLTQSMGKVINAHIKLNEQVRDLRSELTKSIPVLKEYRREVGKAVSANMHLGGKKFNKNNNPHLQFLDEATRRTRELAAESRRVNLGTRTPRRMGGGGGGGGSMPSPSRTVAPRGGGGSGYGGGSNRGGGGRGGGPGGFHMAEFGFAYTLGEGISQPIQNAIVKGFQIGVGFMTKPFEYFGGAFGERIKDQLDDLQAAGGFFSISKRSKNPFVSSLDEAIDFQQETNAVFAKLASSLPGVTNDYVKVGKRLGDTVARMVESDYENARIRANQIRQTEEGKKYYGGSQIQGSGAKERRQVITTLLGDLTKKTTVAGIGGSTGRGGTSGPYGLAGLTERMLSQDKVSMGQFQKYAAVFSNPAITDALERNIENINKSVKNSVARRDALDQMLNEIATPELIEELRTSVDGVYQELRSIFVDPDSGLFGLGRQFEKFGYRINMYGEYVDEAGKAVENITQAEKIDLSIFEIIADIFSTAGQVLVPVAKSISLVFDPLRKVADILMDARHYTAEFARTFNEYREGLKVLSEKQGMGFLKDSLDARASLAAINNLLLQVGAIDKTGALANAKMLKSKDFNQGEMFKQMLDSVLNSSVATEVGKTIGEIVGTVFSEMSRVTGFISGRIAGSNKLFEGIKSAFVTAKGPEAIKNIFTDVFKSMVKLLFEVGKLIPFEGYVLAALAVTLPAAVQGIGMAIAQGVTGMLGMGRDAVTKQFGIAAKGQNGINSARELYKLDKAIPKSGFDPGKGGSEVRNAFARTSDDFGSIPKSTPKVTSLTQKISEMTPKILPEKVIRNVDFPQVAMGSYKATEIGGKYRAPEIPKGPKVIPPKGFKVQIASIARNAIPATGNFLKGVQGRMGAGGMAGLKNPLGMLGKFGGVLTIVTGALMGLEKILSGGSIFEGLGAAAGPIIGTIIGTALLGPLGGVIGGMIGSMEEVTRPLGNAAQAIAGTIGTTFELLGQIGSDLLGILNGLISKIPGVSKGFNLLEFAIFALLSPFKLLEIAISGIYDLYLWIKSKTVGVSPEEQARMNERNTVRLTDELTIQGRQAAGNSLASQKAAEYAKFKEAQGRGDTQAMNRIAEYMKSIDRMLVQQGGKPAVAQSAKPGENKKVSGLTPTSADMAWYTQQMSKTPASGPAVAAAKTTATNVQQVNRKATTQVAHAAQTKNAAVKTQANTSTANTTLGNIRAGLVAVSNKITGLQYVQQIYSLLASGGLNVKTSLSTPLQINSPFGQPAFPGLTLPPLANPYPLPPSPPKPLDPNKWVLGNPFADSVKPPATANAYGSPGVSFGNLGAAVNYEQKHKPAGSDLVIANSSETVIPAAGGHGMEAFIGAMRAGFNSIVQTYSQVQQKQEGVLSTGFSRIQQSYASSAQQQQNALNKINSTLVSNQQQTNTRLSTLETKFTSPSFGGLGGGSVGGGVDAFTPLAQQMGLTMTSGYRPGDPGWHGANRARDFSNGTGPTPQMLQFAQMLASRYGSNLKELIYTPLGFSIKNGQKVAPYAQGSHYNHVHVAYNQGNIGPLAEEMKAMPFGSKLGVVNSSEFVANREQTGLLAKALRGYFVVEKLIRKMMDSQGALLRKPASVNVAQPLIENVVNPAVNQPYINPVVNQPTINPFVNQPIISPVVNQPTINPYVQQPHINPVVNQPAINPFVNQPTINPVVNQPTVNPYVQQPYINPVVNQPAINPFVNQPTINPVVNPYVQQPYINPVVNQPTVNPFVNQPSINPFVNQPTITPFVNQPAITPTQIAAPAPSYGSQQEGPTEINVNASISITQQPGQSADELASIVAMKIGEAVADARAASIFV